MTDPDAATLAAAAWPELEHEQLTLLVPVGSTEQHGPHLPLDTDTRIAEAVAQAVAGPATLVAPALAYGASGEHETFPGTVSIGQQALHALLVEFGRSACRWAHRLVWVNAHGGNLSAVRDATLLLRGEGREVAWYACAVPEADPHAGHAETSILLALNPAVVRRDEARAGNTAPLAELMPEIRRGCVRAVSPSGVLGDPSAASAADGERLLQEMVEALRRAAQRWRPGPDGALC